MAGDAAFWLFALGVPGTGLLAIPVLAGYSAYAWSEAMRWKASLTERPRFAPRFYFVLFLSVVVGFLLIQLGLNVVQMLFWASVLNGLLAPICILLVVLLTSNPAVMGARGNSAWMKLLGWVSFVVTGTAAVGLLVTLLRS